MEGLGLAGMLAGLTSVRGGAVQIPEHAATTWTHGQNTQHMVQHRSGTVAAT